MGKPVVTPWCSGDDIIRRMGVRDAEATGLSIDKLDGFALTASELLFTLSGRQYRGESQRTVVARVGKANYRTATARASLGSWWPVTAVADVVATPLRGTSQPLDSTQWSWSGGIALTVPSQYSLGTVQALLTHGDPPPVAGKLAAAALGAELALNDPDYDGDEDTRLPGLMTSLSRQGVSQSFVSVLDVLKEGATGIHEVDQFLSAVNPIKARSRPRVRKMR